MNRMIEVTILTEVPDDVCSNSESINNWMAHAYPDIDDEELLTQRLLGWKFSDSV